MHLQSPKQPMEPQVKVAWISFAGTVIGAIIAGLFALYIAGEKANRASDRPVSIITNLRAGLVLLDPSRPVSDSFHPSVRNVPAPVPVSVTPAARPAEDQPITEIKAGTCSGLDKDTWSVQLAPVTPLKGKDTKGQDLIGYNVNLRLTNNGTRSLDVNYNQADLTDNEGNQFNVSSSSLQLNNPNFAPNEVSPNADLPVNMRFLGTGSPGKSVSFNINFHIFTKRDDLPHFEKVETLSCVNQSVM